MRCRRRRRKAPSISRTPAPPLPAALCVHNTALRRADAPPQPHGRRRMTAARPAARSWRSPDATLRRELLREPYASAPGPLRPRPVRLARTAIR